MTQRQRHICCSCCYCYHCCCSCCSGSCCCCCPCPTDLNEVFLILIILCVGETQSIHRWIRVMCRTRHCPNPLENNTLMSITLTVGGYEIRIGNSAISTAYILARMYIDMHLSIRPLPKWLELLKRLQLLL